ncbi:MAG: replicative helicase loader/inhibitor [Coprobacillus sp.]
MTIEECKEVLETIIGAYPNFLMGRQPSVVLNSWYRQLKNSSYEDVISNVDNWIADNDYPPTINYIKPWEGH